MNLRIYDNTKINVMNNYKKARINQTVEHVIKMRKKYIQRNKKIMNIWSVIDQLKHFIDISDPDVNIPNAHHAFQTAEGARKNNEPDWFQLMCLIHDLGKIMYMFGCDYDGTSVKEQWSIVGDTFIVGCEIPNNIVYPEFNKLNLDMSNCKYNTKYGKYEKECGLDNCLVSYGHDEYMYQILQNNTNTLPEIAKYIIRYHSLYLWHDKNEYEHLENEKDKEMKVWVKKFNQYDLYTKENIELPFDQLKEYYNKLINKFFLDQNLKW